MNVGEFFKRIGGAQRNGLGAPIMLMILLAPRMVDVVPLAPFMPCEMELA